MRKDNLLIVLPQWAWPNSGLAADLASQSDVVMYNLTDTLMITWKRRKPQLSSCSLAKL
jgi:hypothetical protein